MTLYSHGLASGKFSNVRLMPVVENLLRALLSLLPHGGTCTFSRRNNYPAFATGCKASDCLPLEIYLLWRHSVQGHQAFLCSTLSCCWLERRRRLLCCTAASCLMSFKLLSISHEASQITTAKTAGNVIKKYTALFELYCTWTS